MELLTYIELWKKVVIDTDALRVVDFESEDANGHFRSRKMTETEVAHYVMELSSEIPEDVEIVLV
jgi:hypothetical protein